MLLLTGGPGVGKTTLIKEAVAGAQVNAGGFYTEEVRIDGVRQGFRIVTLDGRMAVLADVNVSGSCRVGKYGVDLQGLEGTGVAALKEAIDKNDLVVVDEIGKMEVCSGAFKDAVMEALKRRKRVLGTIMLQPHPWADAIKRRPEVSLATVTRTNRAAVLSDVLAWLKTTGTAK